MKSYEKETISIMEGLGLKKGKHFTVEGKNAYGDKQNNSFVFPYEHNTDLAGLENKLKDNKLEVIALGVGTHVHGYMLRVVYPSKYK